MNEKQPRKHRPALMVRLDLELRNEFNTYLRERGESAQKVLFDAISWYIAAHRQAKAITPPVNVTEPEQPTAGEQ